jgi:HSP20 family protein
MGFLLLFCFLSEYISRGNNMKRQSKSPGKLMLLDSNDAIAAETDEIHGRIRERAYQLSQQRGSSGREMDDWLSAESDVISVPAMDMIEKAGAFQVQIAAPGIYLEDVQVMATPDQMLIKCVRRHSHEDGAAILHICDFKSATLFRSFRFPEPVDLRRLKIGLADGILHVTALKAVAAAQADRPPRKRATARKTTAAKSKRGAA